MRFSSRTNWELAQNQISELAGDLARAGKPVIDLSESNPTRCGFLYPQSEILSALTSSENMNYSPAAPGMLEARQAVCRYYQQKGIAIEPDQVFLTASTSEAYSFVFRLLANPGDAIIFPRPSYPLFNFLVDLNDLTMANYQLVYKQRWELDQRSLREAISSVTKGVVLVNPNNPTGSVFNEEEQRAVVHICREADLPVICDEVFLDYPFSQGQRLTSFLQNPEVLSFVLGGVSKALALPQMKISWIILNGPQDLVEAARQRLDVIADTYLSANTPSQNALKSWLDLQPVIQKEVLARVRHNRQRILDLLKNIRHVELLNAEGGWYAVLKIPQSFCEEKLVQDLLREDQVFVHPGYFFDFSDEPYLVISLLVPTEILETGMKRILKRIG